MSTEQVVFLVVHSDKTEVSKVVNGIAGHSSTGVGGQLTEVDQELPGGKPISRLAKQPGCF